MRRLAAFLLLGSGIARGDEPVDDGELHGGLTRESTGPLLRFDTDVALRSNAEGFDADVKREATDFAIGSRTRARIEANAWTSPIFAGEGWGTTLSLVHDFKVIQVGIEAGYQRVDSQVGHGAYRIIGLSLTRTHRFSKWMTGWISLSIGQRQWIGVPPPGETNDTTVTLSLGTTFR